MARVFLILLAIALLIWAGERYYMGHHGQEFWNSLGSPMTSSPAPEASAGTSPSATPGPTVDSCRASLRTQGQKLLLPLDQSKDFSPGDTMRILRETQRYLVQYRRDPNYPRLTQACGVLAQMLQERQAYFQRYQRDSATPAASATPSALHMATLQTTVGTGTESATFFRDRVLSEWRERCAYYEPIINGLLTPAN